MILIHCTQKLLKELGNPPLQSMEGIPITGGLGNWYCNLLRIDRRKCLLLTNEKTLYSFLIPGVKKESLKNLLDEFLINLNLNLQAEGFGLKVINKVMQEYLEIRFAKTVSKKVLGQMNQLAFEYEVLVQVEEGLEKVKILEMNRHINRTIMKGIKYLHPVEALRDLLLGEDKDNARK
jgi:hypothetical protein